jgi:hypothetical protein
MLRKNNHSQSKKPADYDGVVALTARIADANPDAVFYAGT